MLAPWFSTSGGLSLHLIRNHFPVLNTESGALRVHKKAKLFLNKQFVRQAEGHPLAGQWSIPWGVVDHESNNLCQPRLGFF